MPNSASDLAGFQRIKIEKSLKAGDIADDVTKRLLGGELARQLYVDQSPFFKSKIVAGDPEYIALLRKSPNVKGTIQSGDDVTTLATCLVVADPNVSHKLVTAQPGSDREKKSLEAVLSILQSCVPQGLQIALDRNLLRSEINRSFYRYIYAPENLWAE